MFKLRKREDSVLLCDAANVPMLAMRVVLYFNSR